MIALIAAIPSPATTIGTNTAFFTANPSFHPGPMHERPGLRSPDL
jgi:hypothetical protein